VSATICKNAVGGQFFQNGAFGHARRRLAVHCAGDVHNAAMPERKEVARDVWG
jgi:hypothetical protein